MSRLEVPLAFRKLRTTGDLVVHAELILAIKTDSDVFASALHDVTPEDFAEWFRPHGSHTMQQ